MQLAFEGGPVQVPKYTGFGQLSFSACCKMCQKCDLSNNVTNCHQLSTGNAVNDACQEYGSSRAVPF